MKEKAVRSIKDGEKKEEEKEVKLSKKGRTCTSCATSIGNNLKKRDGVKKARASYKKREATVIIDEKVVTIEDMKKVIAQAGDGPGDYELEEG